MPPAVPPSSQMRRTTTAIWIESDRNFSDAKSRKHAADDHFAGKLHPRGLQSEHSSLGSIEPAQTTVKVAYGNVKKQSANEAEHRVSQIAVHQWHCAWLNSVKPIAHYEVCTASKPIDKLVDRCEIVTVIGVAHNGVLTTGRFNSAHEGRAVTLLLN